MERHIVSTTPPAGVCAVNSTSLSQATAGESQLSPRREEDRGGIVDYAGFIGVGVLLSFGSILESAEVFTVKDARASSSLQTIVATVSFLTPILVGVFGVVFYRGTRPFGFYWGKVTLVQLVLYALTCGVAAFATSITVGVIVSFQCAIILTLLMGIRFDLFRRTSSETHGGSNKRWMIPTVIVFLLRLLWYSNCITTEALEGVAYIVSATLPPTFTGYTCMWWLSSSGYRTPVMFWGPDNKPQWGSLLAIQTFLSTFTGFLVALIAMAKDSASAITTALFLAGITFVFILEYVNWKENRDGTQARQPAHAETSHQPNG